MDTIDANTDATVETDSSSDPVNVEPIQDDNGLVSTSEFQPVKEQATEVDEDTDASDGAEQDTPEDDSSEEKDFHDHPRFKELINEKNELKNNLAALKSEIEYLRKPVSVQKPAEPQRKFNWANMDNEELIEAFTNNPKEFLAEFHELSKQDLTNEFQRKADQEKQRTVEEKQKATYESYFSKTDGALDAWKDGSIQKFMDDNPGHNPISAHMAMTEPARIQAAAEKAAAEAINKYKKELKQKGRASSPSNENNPPRRMDTTDDELKNPDKHGGAKAVLVNRLKRMMAS